MIKLCQNNHAQICYDTTNFVGEVGEDIVRIKDELECPVCERIKAIKEANKRKKEFADEVNNSNKEVTELRTRITHQSKRLEDIKYSLKSILANCSTG